MVHVDGVRPAWPKTSAEIREAGYRFTNWGRCECGRKIAWTVNSGGGKVPMEEVRGTVRRFQPHKRSCPLREKFRAGPDPRQRQLF